MCVEGGGGFKLDKPSGLCDSEQRGGKNEFREAAAVCWTASSGGQGGTVGLGGEEGACDWEQTPQCASSGATPAPQTRRCSASLGGRKLCQWFDPIASSFLKKKENV